MYIYIYISFAAKRRNHYKSYTLTLLILTLNSIFDSNGTIIMAIILYKLSSFYCVFSLLLFLPSFSC